MHLLCDSTQKSKELSRYLFTCVLKASFEGLIVYPFLSNGKGRIQIERSSMANLSLDPMKKFDLCL
jgi:hypothetical protein